MPLHHQMVTIQRNLLVRRSCVLSQHFHICVHGARKTRNGVCTLSPDCISAYIAILKRLYSLEDFEFARAYDCKLRDHIVLKLRDWYDNPPPPQSHCVFIAQNMSVRNEEIYNLIKNQQQIKSAVKEALATKANARPASTALAGGGAPPAKAARQASGPNPKPKHPGPRVDPADSRPAAPAASGPPASQSAPSGPRWGVPWLDPATGLWCDLSTGTPGGKGPRLDANGVPSYFSNGWAAKNSLQNNSRSNKQGKGKKGDGKAKKGQGGHGAPVDPKVETPEPIPK